MLGALLQGDARSSGATTAVTVWQLLACLGAEQLRALSGCPKFFDLPHSDAPEWALPEAAVDAMLEVGPASIWGL